VKGGFVGNKDCGTEPTRFVLDVTVNIAASRRINWECEGVPKQHVGKLMGNTVTLAADGMKVVVNDNPLTVLSTEGGSREMRQGQSSRAVSPPRDVSG
jgi:hypothetical protein